MGVDIGQSGMDLGDSLGFGGSLGLGQQGGPFLVGGQHGFQQALRTVRRFLRDTADSRPSGQGDGARIRRLIAGDDPEKGRLAAAVAANQTGLVAGRQGQPRVLEQDTAGDAYDQVRYLQHGRLISCLGLLRNRSNQNGSI